MCGMVGYCSKTWKSIDSLHRLSSAIANRGPDDNGYWFSDEVGFAHRRLSILDLSAAGHQPMITRDGRFCIVFNGEIYNYQAIRSELEKDGLSFVSNSDTEVILYGFAKWGADICRRLDGIFAFTIWDNVKKELFLARDRSGVKPLYYLLDAEKLVFCSEAKPLAKEFALKTNDDAKILFLATGSIPEPNTYWDKLKAFPAGNFAVYKNNLLSFVCFTRYEVVPKINISFPTAVKTISSLLHEAVESQLVADAPIGVFLSGGVDSSALVAIAKKYRADIQTVSLVFDEAQCDESLYQESVASSLGVKRDVFKVDKAGFLDSIPEFFLAMDQPTIDGLNVFLVSKAARSVGLKTVLSGLGSDEIFAGYPSFKDSKKLSYLSMMPPSFFSLLQGKLQKLEYLSLKSTYGIWLARRGIFSPAEIHELFGVEKNKLFELLKETESKFEFSDGDNVDKAGFYELNCYMKNQLLRDADVFGMSKSLEIRVPFLANSLVDFVLKIPSAMKLDSSINKPLLVEALKTEIPSLVWNRPKQGFVLPFENWLSNDGFIYPKGLNGKHWSKKWAMRVLESFDA